MAEELNDLLTDLQYEGRSSLGKNLKKSERYIQSFERELAKHIEIEEKMLFPFFESHVPRLATALRLLEAEHEAFHSSFHKLKGELQKLTTAKSAADHAKLLHKIHETGTYLVCLLKHHMQMETGSLYRMIERELKAGERKQLKRILQNA